MTVEHQERLSRFCETAYSTYHRPEFIAPDPLELVREYSTLADREIAGLIASSLALGRVEAIVSAVRSVMEGLERIDASVSRAVRLGSRSDLRERFSSFSYRFFNAEQLVGLLAGAGAVLRRYGTLEAAVSKGIAADSLSGRPALVRGIESLVCEIRRGAEGALDDSILLARPERGSACKRLFLFARWLVRSDQVDPGGWRAVRPCELLMPVDTHVIRVARHLGLTRRTQPSLLVSREITDALRRIDPDDPVRFDFALTRPGIHPRLDEEGWLGRYDARSA